MFALSRKYISNLSLGLFLSVCSFSAFASQGLVNNLYVLTISEWILVDGGGGLSCSLKYNGTTVSHQAVRIVTSILSEAKARGRQVIVNCGANGITDITLL